MENNDQLFYDKLDLEPFTFSSPNSTGLNAIELKNLLEDAVNTEHYKKDISKISSSSQGGNLIELFANNSEVFAPLPQKESTKNIGTYQQDWKQPLPQQKPKIEQTTSRRYHSNIQKYLVSLNNMHNGHLKNKNSVKPIQKIATTEHLNKNPLNLASFLLEVEKTLDTTKYQSNDPLIHLINQLNRKTLEKLRNRLIN